MLRSELVPTPVFLDEDYPCPCDCQGRLTGIALVEAMGCCDCQQLFILIENGQAIAKPASHPWTRRQWYWTQQGWYCSRRSWLLSPVGLALWVVGVLLGGGLLCLFWPFPTVELCLKLLGGAGSLLLLLNLMTLFSFRH